MSYDWIRKYQTVSRLTGFNVADVLEKSFDRNVFMENDGTAAVIAKRLFEVGKLVNNFVYLFLEYDDWRRGCL